MPHRPPKSARRSSVRAAELELGVPATADFDVKKPSHEQPEIDGAFFDGAKSAHDAAHSNDGLRRTVLCASEVSAMAGVGLPPFSCRWCVKNLDLHALR